MNVRPSPARVALTLFLCVAPWLTAWWSLYRQHSAPLAFVLYHAVCFAGGFLLRSPGLPDPEAKLWSLRWQHLLGAIFGANLATFFAYTLVGAALLDKPHVMATMAARGVGPATYLWLFPYFAFVNPLAEEFFWRGGVYPTFRRLFKNPLTAAIAASFFFGGWHWVVIQLFFPPALALVATLVVMSIGLVLTLVYENTRRLYYPVALHALAGDAPLLLLLLLLGRS